MGSKENVLIVLAVILFMVMVVLSVRLGVMDAVTLPSGFSLTGNIIADSEQAPGQCEDSDGSSPLVAGRVIVGQQVRYDYCLSERVLKEWSCVDGLAETTFIPCDGGCSDGRCGE